MSRTEMTPAPAPHLDTTKGTPLPAEDRPEPRWRGNAASWLVYALAVAVLLGPSLVGLKVALPHDILLARLPWSATEAGVETVRNPELGDTIDVYYPVQRELLTRIRAGRDATWLRDVGFGYPGWQFVGWGALSPFNLPALVLPFDLAWSWSQALRLLAAMVGADVLARSYGLGRAAATVAGLSFGLCGYMVGWLGWPQSHVGALVPWLCWAARRTAEPGGPWWAAVALALTTAGLWLGGFPAVALYALFAAGIVALHSALRQGPGAAPGLVLSLAAVLAGTASVAFTLVPTLGFLAELDLSARDSAFETRAFPLALWTFVIPHIFGDVVEHRRWIGGAYVETIAYAGVVTLAAVLPAWLLAPRRAGLWLWSGLGLGFGLLAYGFAPLTALVSVIPGLSTNPPHRVLVIVALSIALVGAFGVDALLRALRGEVRMHWRAVVTAAAGSALLAVVWALVRPLIYLRDLAQQQLPDPGVRAAVVDAMRDEAFAGAGLLAAALLVVAATIFLAHRRRGVAARILGPALVAVVAVDMTVFAWGWNVQSERTNLFPDAPGIQAATSAGDQRAAGADGVGLPNAHLLYPGWADLRARGFLTARQREILRASGTSFASPTNYNFTSAETAGWVPWLAASGVATMLVPDNAVSPPGWTRTAAGPISLLDVPDALPRVYAVGRAEAVEPGRARRAVEEAGTAALDEVVFVEPYDPARVPELPNGVVASVETVWADAATVAAGVSSPDGAVLVVLDAALAGWSATVDGEPAPVVQANHLFLGVPVPPGDHEVVLSYTPPGLAVGTGVSVAGALGIVALGAVSRRARGGGPSTP